MVEVVYSIIAGSESGTHRPDFLVFLEQDQLRMQRDALFFACCCRPARDVFAAGVLL